MRTITEHVANASASFASTQLIQNDTVGSSIGTRRSKK